MIEQEIKDVATKVDEIICDIFAHNDFPSLRLKEAMIYTSIGAGKRFRPFLCYFLAKQLNVNEKDALLIGSAIELIHCYTLIHDDLPSMDNDDIRRGKPSCHKKFNEYSAILCGDALQSEAFYLLSSKKINIDCNIKIKIINELAKQIGARNLIAGQMLDMDLKNQLIKNIDITYINSLKTSKLIAICFKVIAILAKSDETFIEKINLYGEKIGSLFQIIDDIKDMQDETDINIVKSIGYKETISLLHKIDKESRVILEEIGFSNLEVINKYLLTRIEQV